MFKAILIAWGLCAFYAVVTFAVATLLKRNNQQQETYGQENRQDKTRTGL